MDLAGLMPADNLSGLQLTCGGLQSAHTAAVAAACAEQGIKAHLLVRGERPAVPTGFHLLARMFAQVTYVPRSEYADRPAMFQRYADQIKTSMAADINVSPVGYVLCIRVAAGYACVPSSKHAPRENLTACQIHPYCHASYKSCIVVASGCI